MDSSKFACKFKASINREQIIENIFESSAKRSTWTVLSKIKGKSLITGD